MAIFIPDLFGSYVDGREKAIDSNWKDMQNYNSVLNGQIDNARDMATFNAKVMQEKGKGLSSIAHGETDYDKSRLDTNLLKYMLNGAMANDGAWMAQYAANRLNGMQANAAATSLFTSNSLSRDTDDTDMKHKYATLFYDPLMQAYIDQIRAGTGTGTGTGANSSATSGSVGSDSLSSVTGVYGLPGNNGNLFLAPGNPPSLAASAKSADTGLRLPGTSNPDEQPEQ